MYVSRAWVLGRGKPMPQHFKEGLVGLPLVVLFCVAPRRPSRHSQPLAHALSCWGGQAGGRRMGVRVSRGWSSEEDATRRGVRHPRLSFPCHTTHHAHPPPALTHPSLPFPPKSASTPQVRLMDRLRRAHKSSSSRRSSRRRSSGDGGGDDNFLYGRGRGRVWHPFVGASFFAPWQGRPSTPH